MDHRASPRLSSRAVGADFSPVMAALQQPGAPVAGPSGLKWAIDPKDDSGRTGGLCMDCRRRGRGPGRAAVQSLPVHLRRSRGCTTASLSRSPDTEAVRVLYVSPGFIETGGLEEDEIVARRVQ